MDEKLCRQACEIIGCQFIGYNQFLTNAIAWAGNNIGDFELGYDDYERYWYGRGVYQVDAEWQEPDPIGDNPHDAMARLIVDYSNWKAVRFGAPKDAEQEAWDEASDEVWRDTDATPPNQ